MLASSTFRARILAAGTRVRVLVVDDSVVIRRLVTHALEEDGRIEVVGSASNGVIALQRIQQFKPDLITLDIEMPEMDGLETLRQLRKLYPGIVVVMFSTLTERGAAATLDALSLGANDYVTKAANVGSLDRSMASLRSELLPKILQFFQIGPAAVPVQPKPFAPVPARLPQRPAQQPRAAALVPRIVVIGISTGGPNALAQIMPMFPGNFPLPVLIVQHMPPLFTRFLADRLNVLSSLRVEEVKEGSPVEPGKVLLAAGGYHMRVRKRAAGVIATMDQEAPENSCRPAVDVLFRSVADIYGGAAIAVMLTGMGSDGLLGTEILRAKGAYVIAQDESSSVVWGMPGSVVKAGLADAVVDLDRVVPKIIERV